MAKKKRHFHRQKGNTFLQKQYIRVDGHRQAEKDTYTQFMVDLFMLSLNDPEVMGKDVLGKKRLVRVVADVSKKYDKYHPALEKCPEADYHQEKMDAQLKSIIGEEDFVPFEKRYDWVRKQTY